MERSLIDEYLRMRGYDPHALATLDASERDSVLRDASIYASSKLSEVESRSHYVHDLHDAIGDIAKTGKA
ncbi:MAG TPA: hypothetical protein VG871_09305 [Vicinamibacterales bacterium]|nr:hypothetical protein [Vicinamibacterales bacterium]